MPRSDRTHRFAPQLTVLEDRTTPSISLLSVNAAGTAAGNGNSYRAFEGPSANENQHTVSGDGRYVLFESHASDLTTDPVTGGQTVLFVRDTKLNATTLVSKDTLGKGRDVIGGEITADGRYAVFTANYGSPDDPNNPPMQTTGSFAQPEFFVSGNGLFRRDLQTNTTEIVDVGSSGLGGPESANVFDTSADGRYIAFTYTVNSLDSSQSGLLPGTPPGLTAVYVRDMVAGTTKLVSHTPAGGFSAEDAFSPVISANGQTILFTSPATDLVANPDANNGRDLFAYDVASGTVSLVTVAVDGSAGNRETDPLVSHPIIDASGTKVLFPSGARNLVAGDDPNGFANPVYLRDLSTGKTTAVTRNPATGEVVFGGNDIDTALSADGKFVVFEDPVTGGTPYAGDTGTTGGEMYLYEVATGRYTLVTHTPDGQPRTGDRPAVSDDGRYVSFASSAADLVAGLTPGNGGEVYTYVYDRLADKTFAASVDTSGTKLAGTFLIVRPTYLSGDGKAVVFFSDATTLGFADANNNRDMFANTVPDIAPLVAAPAVSAGPSQANPTATGPVTFTVTFNGQVSGFDASDVSFAGSTAGGTLAAAVTSTGNRTFTVTVTGMTSTGDVVVSVPAGAATAPDGSPSLASPTPAAVRFDNGVANTAPTISAVGNQTTTAGTAVGPISFTVGDTETPTQLTVAGVSSNPTLVPAAGIVVGGSGATRTVTVTPAAGQTGTATITLTVTDAGGLTATTAFTLTVPPAAGRVLAVSGAANGTASVYAAASGRFSNPPAATTPAGLFGGFAGEVRVATGDFNGDGFPDTVLVTGPGTKTGMAIVSGKDNSVLLQPTDPFGDANFTFGGFVTAGDIDGDGRAEWVVTPELRGGPRVIIFHLLPNGTFDLTSPGQPSLVANFFGIGDPAFRDGDRAALGDVNGDGILDVFSIAAFNGGPRTALYNGADVLTARNAGRDPVKLVGDFFATTDGSGAGRGGRAIAAGDVNGDGRADFIVTGDNLLGTGNQVVIFSGADLAAGRVPGFGATVLANFGVSGMNPGALVSVAATNADGDGRSDLAVGSGAGQASSVKVYLGTNLSGTTEPTSTSFDPFGTVALNGVFVG